MIVRLRPDADPAAVQRSLAERGLWVRRLEEHAGATGAITFLVEEHSRAVERDSLLAIEGVAGVAAAASAHPRVDAQPAIVDVAGVRFGAATPVVLAGPCAIESELQVAAIADRLSRRGVRFLRGGAFKPRTSPYAFHGHGLEALKWMRRAADATGMKVVTEALSPEDAPRVAEYADLLQIGSRSMQSFPLLKAAAATRKPILLKRGMAATVEEWLAAGEWCLVHGAQSVIFCERGIRGFDPATRNLLDLGSVALLAHVHRQPVIVDPSHALGRRDLIAPLARAAIAAGACGLLLETHDDPGRALSDGPQALLPAEIDGILKDVRTAA